MNTKSERIKAKYCAAKLRDLREFGYTDLTLSTVESEYDKVVAGETGLMVIGLFIKDDFDKAKRLQIAEGASK